MRTKYLIIFVFIFLQCEFQCYNAADVSSTTEASVTESTTKKSGGFFKGFKKFFGAGGDKTTEAPATSTTTTTTPRPLPPIPKATAPPQRPAQNHNPFGSGSDLPGFPPRPQPNAGGNKPGLTALSYPSTKPPLAPMQPTNKLAPMLPISTSTTTVKPIAVLQSSTTTTTTTTTTTKPNVQVTTAKPKEQFPGLPTPKAPFVKEDFPALPTQKTSGSVTPTTPQPQKAVWSTLPSPQPVNINLPSTTRATMASSTPASTAKTGTSNSLATDAELQEASEAIFAKETNSKLSHITINLQGKTSSMDTNDVAPNPLLEADDQALKSNSITKMLALFNNYELDTKVNEYVTPMERREENEFLDVIMVSGVMRTAMQFLQKKGIVSPDPGKHRELVKNIWFSLYSRGLGKIGSSGFEHVFLNEIKDGEVIGLHNWAYYLQEERAGHIDYKGYIKKLDLGNKAVILKNRSSFNGINKPTNSMFIGTSPELEMALYTMCFVLRPDGDCPVQLGGQKFEITTYTWKYRGNKLIASAFPKI